MTINVDIDQIHIEVRDTVCRSGTIGLDDILASGVSIEEYASEYDDSFMEIESGTEDTEYEIYVSGVVSESRYNSMKASNDEIKENYKEKVNKLQQAIAALEDEVKTLLSKLTVAEPFGNTGEIDVKGGE